MQTYKDAADKAGASERDLLLTIAGTSTKLIKRDDEGFEFTEEGNSLASVVAALKSVLPDLPTAHLWQDGRCAETIPERKAKHEDRTS